MKVSINFANSYSNVKLDTEGIDALSKKIGSQLGAIEDIEFWSKKYHKATVVRVVECVKHPNADKLSLCRVDDGGVNSEIERDDRGLVQVICGADNVKSGILAVWLPPGSTVPATFDAPESFTLESRELRGIISHGMLASPDELDLDGGHDGILLLEKGKPGQLFVDVYGLNDIVFDLENKMFTHRPDCFGVLGVARELAGIQQLEFKSPDWYLNEPVFKDQPISSLKLKVEVETGLVSRFMAVAMTNIEVKPSSQELQTALLVSGIKPINNVVDITNYLMQLTAQPLHAYDYDKIKSLSKNEPTLKARMSKVNEKISLLNGKTIQLVNDDVVMISTDEKPIGIGGIMGGSSTEVDENTKNIVLECATFEPYNIRKTSMVYGLFTDAVTRFNKGQNNVQNDRVLAKALEMISEEASGEQASEVFDIQKKSVAEEQVVETTASFINTRLGSMLSAKEIASLLENVEFKTEISNDKIKITAPFWRTDIIIAEDIVEEVGRLYGYDRLPVDLPTVKLSIAKPNKVQKQSKNIREFLAAAGANEILTYSFVNEIMLVKADQNPKLAFKIANALSPALEYYRLSLMPSLLDKINTNIKSGYDEFALFEIGKGHNKDFYQENNLPDERSSLALVVTASEKKAKDHASEAFFTAKSFLNYLAEKIGQEFSYKPIEDADSTDFDDQTVKPFEKGRSAWIVNSSGKTIGVVGEFRSEVAKSFKLPAYTAGFELDLNGLGNTMYSSAYKEQPKYPKVEQDISLKVNKVVNFATISKLLVSEIERNQPANCLLENRLIDIYEVDDSKTYTFRIKLASYEKTLSSKQVNTLLDTVSQLLNNKIGATRI